MTALLPLLWIVTAQPAAVVQGDDFSCPRGQVRNEDTDGECCWPGQAWSMIQDRCVGLADCPEGFTADESGEDCVRGSCPAGQVPMDLMGAHCCWPGQVWEDDACTGEPACLRGWVPQDGGCVREAEAPRLAPEPAALPYAPPAPGDYVRVEAGTARIGSPRREKGRFHNERAFEVTLTRPLLVKVTEVTQREWQGLVGRNPSYFRHCGERCPVERLNWYEALTWLNRLSEREGLTPCYQLDLCRGTLGGGCPGDAPECRGDYACNVRPAGPSCTGYRLPTEAEWEYLARAGTPHATYAGALAVKDTNDAPVLNGIAWYGGNSGATYEGGAPCNAWVGRAVPTATHCGPQPVGQKAPNPWGVRDALGNVMEWTWDAFATYPRKPTVDRMVSVGYDRVVRGGAWQTHALGMRVAVRRRVRPEDRSYTIGLRPVRTAPAAGAVKAAPPDAGLKGPTPPRPPRVTPPQPDAGAAVDAGDDE